ncbi:signal recognition particle receptor FtsY [mine drainage metagenome]|uniref:Signal recognition particle receptor FtsY n=1 Tax=mine drainage metagenome TaxID=410659 RepID=A0A1J5QU49_9ZZZZ
MLNFFKKDKEQTPAQEPTPTWAERLKEGLARTRSQLGSQLGALFGGGRIDDEVYEQLETILLTADVGVSATQALLEDLRTEVKRQALSDTSQLRAALQESLIRLLEPLAQPLDTGAHQPCVIMLVGVNGAGKTTTIGKLAWNLQRQGKSVLIAAGDTFRAAAREQLQAWGARNNVHVVSQDGGDPAAVIFDAVNSARARGIDVVLADTAGRLPTQLNLMEEIRKVKRVIQKTGPLPASTDNIPVIGQPEQITVPPHEIVLVIDGNTGQNALTQVMAFDDALGLTGLIVTKLDGTAKGGVLAAIARERPIPVYFIGIGERLEDLQTFNAREFAQALLS